jgi:hypothetical protein
MGNDGVRAHHRVELIPGATCRRVLGRMKEELASRMIFEKAAMEIIH